MKTIRIGNDIQLNWYITRFGEPEDFSKKNLSIALIDKFNNKQEFDYTINDNVISGTFYGKNQKTNGVYRLLLIENKDENDMVSLDYIDCFCLSNKLKNQTSIGSDTTSTINTEIVEVSSEISTTPDLSNYAKIEYVDGKVLMLQNEISANTEYIDTLSGNVNTISGNVNNIESRLVNKANLINGTVPTNELPIEEIKSEVTDSIMPEVGPDAAGHEYIDLGLPSGTLWATMNVGATNNTDAGLYFQWGDTQGYTADQVGRGEGQKSFSWKDYKWAADSNGSIISKYNITDGKTTLDLEDDAVAANWGGDWRMPTEEQYQELLDNTDISWTKVNNVSGYRFTHKTDSSKYIFIPTAGCAINGNISLVDSYGYIWSRSLHIYDYNVKYGHSLRFSSSSVNVDNSIRNGGLSVRGVLGAGEKPSKLHKVAVTGDYNDLENKPTTYTKTEVDNAITAATSTKQDTLTAGSGITINNNVISATGGCSSYTAGDGIDITNDVISVTGKVDLSAFTAHKDDTVIHVTSEDKTNWNGAVANASNAVTALGGLSLVKLTESEYAALSTKDSNTLYIILDSSN